MPRIRWQEMRTKTMAWLAKQFNWMAARLAGPDRAPGAQEEQLRRQNEYLAALHETTLGVVSRLKIAELLEAIVERAVKLVGATDGFVYLVSPEQDTLELRVGVGPSSKDVGLRLKQGEGLSGQVWEVGQPMAVDDYPTWSGHSAQFDGEPVGPEIGVPLKSGSEVVGVLGVARPPAAPPFQQDEVDLINRFAHLASIALDNARLHTSLQEELAGRVRMEQALQSAYQVLEQRVQELTHERARYEEAERRQRVAAGLREVLAAINSRQSLSEMLDFIVRQACGLMGCDATSIERLESKEGPLCYQSACGLDAEMVSSMVFPLDLAVTGRAVRERRPIAIQDTAANVAHVTREYDWPPAPQRALMQRHIEQFPSLLAMPLIVRDQDYGALTFYYREPHRFSEEEMQLARSVADQVALAIESAWLREQAEQAAALAERSRLARELHDSVTQNLYSMTLYAEAAARLLTAGESLTAAGYLRDLRDTSQEALREMRLLIFELRPLALEKSGLSGALQARLDAVEKRGGMQAELRVEGVEGMADVAWLPLAVQQELYHIAQEALNNSLKHAKAQRVQVRLAVSDATTRLEVSDDGAGFDPASAGERGGLGLPGMKERVQRIGGQLEIESAPGRGTMVAVTVPRGEI